MQKSEETADKACCIPARDGAPVVENHKPPAVDAVKDNDAVDIPGGTALVGTNAPQIPDDGEGPLRKVAVKPFRMAATAVTNAQFRAFIDATGFVTEAERFGWSFVFWSQVPDAVGPTHAVSEVEWWRRVDGATWFGRRDRAMGSGSERDHALGAQGCALRGDGAHGQLLRALVSLTWPRGRARVERARELCLRSGPGSSGAAASDCVVEKSGRLVHAGHADRA